MYKREAEEAASALERMKQAERAAKDFEDVNKEAARQIADYKRQAERQIADYKRQADEATKALEAMKLKLAANVEAKAVERKAPALEINTADEIPLSLSYEEYRALAAERKLQLEIA